MRNLTITAYLCCRMKHSFGKSNIMRPSRHSSASSLKFVSFVQRSFTPFLKASLHLIGLMRLGLISPDELYTTHEHMNVQ